MAKLRDWGVKGIKVDFWQSDKQDRMQQYRAVLQDAADYHLLVDFHGCDDSARLGARASRIWSAWKRSPGAEQYKFRADYPAEAAWQNTVLPFTRNVVGTMDFTPVTFTDTSIRI